MERGKETGFKDKAGRSIHVDDILQHRLGKFGKSSGPVNSRVIEFHGKYQQVIEAETDLSRGGNKITEDFCKNATVLHCNHIPT